MDDRDYRSFVGPPERYDLMAAIQFNLMTLLGMRETNTLLDIGCGSLRAGRLFIVYLKPRKYYGLEPCGWDLINLKQPSFLFADDWSFTQFGVQFDFLIENCLANAAKCMHRNSIFAATFKIGNEDYKGSEWMYPETVKYTPESIMSMFSNAGLAAEQVSWFHPTQIWYLVSKPENRANLVEHARNINRFFSSTSKTADRNQLGIKRLKRVMARLLSIGRFVSQ